MNTGERGAGLSRAQRLAATVAIGLLLGLVALAAAQRWQEKLHPEPARAKPPPAVEVIELWPAPFGLARAYRGTVEADSRAVVSARLTARLVTVHHREGAAVDAGEPLLVLDDAELRRETERLRAVAERLTGELEIATRQLERDRELHARKLIPDRALDESLQRARTLEAQQRENSAALRLTETRLGYTVERAPFDGIVQRNFVHEGELAALGQPLIELVSAAALKAVVAVPQADAALIGPGQEVQLEVPALHQSWPATVDRIYPALDQATRTATFAAFFPSSAAVRPGMAVTARVEFEGRPDAITLPAHAVHRDTAGAWVWLLEDGRARRRDVQPGPSRQGRTLIEDGLSAGERVIVTADRRLDDGTPVSAAEPQAGN
jgi:RND family efflux transporter MFP subunit